MKFFKSGAVFLSSVAGFVSINSSVEAAIDPKIHKLCLEAKDYAGCVSAMRGEPSVKTVREIRS